MNKKRNILILLIVIFAAILRLYALDKYPAGINADEAAIGYNAYSLLQTGHDEHGAAWPLVFRSFDDYKPPLYFYMVLPFVKVMGLNIWSVRLPSALLGILSVYLVYLLTNQLFKPKRDSLLTAGHVSALLLATSPWHLQFSRGGWEANAASVLLLLGTYSLYRGVKSPRWFWLAGLSLVASLYTYHSLRIISPLIGLFFVVSVWKKLIKPKRIKVWLPALAICGLLLVPLVLQMVSKEGQSRFNGVSVFSDTGPYWEALALRREDADQNSLYSRAIHNPKVTYALRFAQNYLSHYSPRFLFITGDEIARSKVPEVGQTFIILAPFLLTGLLLLFKKQKLENNLILFWFFVSPLAASLTFQSPHALRAQNMVYPMTIITGLGLFHFYLWLKSKHRAVLLTGLTLFIVFFGWETAKYLHQYYLHYPAELPFAWEYGFDQVASYIKTNGDKYDHIIISDHYDQPYIIMAFYLQYPPSTLQKEIKLTPRDNFGFSTVKNFGKFEFRPVNFDQDSKLHNTLIVATTEKVPESMVTSRVYSPIGESLFKFISIK